MEQDLPPSGAEDPDRAPKRKATGRLYRSHLETVPGEDDFRSEDRELEVADPRLLYRRLSRQLREGLVPELRIVSDELWKLLAEKITFTPEDRDGRQGFRFQATGTVEKLLAGVAPHVPARRRPFTVDVQTPDTGATRFGQGRAEFSARFLAPSPD